MRDLQNPSWFPLEAGNHEVFCKSLIMDVFPIQVLIFVS